MRPRSRFLFHIYYVPAGLSQHLVISKVKDLTLFMGRPLGKVLRRRDLEIWRELFSVTSIHKQTRGES